MLQAEEEDDRNRRRAERIVDKDKDARMADGIGYRWSLDLFTFSCRADFSPFVQSVGISLVGSRYGKVVASTTSRWRICVYARMCFLSARASEREERREKDSKYLLKSMPRLAADWSFGEERKEREKNIGFDTASHWLTTTKENGEKSTGIDVMLFYIRSSFSLASFAAASHGCEWNKTTTNAFDQRGIRLRKTCRERAISGV